MHPDQLGVIFRRRWFGSPDVDPRARDLPFSKRRGESDLVNDSASSRVDDDRARFEEFELGGGYQVLGFRQQGAVQGENVDLRQEFREGGGSRMGYGDMWGVWAG